MSRMTKFLKQTCLYEAAVRDEAGNLKYTKFGEPLYEIGVTIKCRHEIATKDILTTNGSVLRSDSVYYTDESYRIRTDDKLDGRIVRTVSTYINSLGKIEGYESHA